MRISDWSSDVCSSDLAAPMSRPALKLVTRELMRRNGLTNGMLYMQVTRGVAPRDHKFPKASTKPALVMTTRQTKPHSEQVLSEGLKVITVTAQIGRASCRERACQYV